MSALDAMDANGMVRCLGCNGTGEVHHVHGRRGRQVCGQCLGFGRRAPKPKYRAKLERLAARQGGEGGAA